MSKREAVLNWCWPVVWITKIATGDRYPMTLRYRRIVMLGYRGNA